MDNNKERRVLGRLIWRERLRAEQPDLKDREQIKALWQQQKKEYVQLATRIMRRADKRGYKIGVTGPA